MNLKEYKKILPSLLRLYNMEIQLKEARMKYYDVILVKSTRIFFHEEMV